MRPASVLFVDGDDAVLARLGECARRAGLEPLLAATGKKALALAACERPQLAVIEHNLPDIPGVDVGVALQSDHDVPFMLLTSCRDEAVVARAAERGAFAYLLKPMELDAVGPQLRVVLARAEQQRELRQRLDRVAAEAVLEAEQTERQSVAAELHDGVVQEIVGAALLVAALEAELRKTGTVRPEGLSMLYHVLSDAKQHCRSLSHGVFHDIGAAATLGTSLRALARTESARGRIRCRYGGALAMPGGLSDVMAHHLLRIAQEAVRNTIRHSGGSVASIRLVLRRQELVLTIRDNGRGLAGGPARGGQGIGWQTMRFRAHLIGGELVLRNGPRAGSEVIVTVPLEESGPRVSR